MFMKTPVLVEFGNTLCDFSPKLAQDVLIRKISLLLEAHDNIVGHFGDVDLTFEVLEY